MKVLRRTLALFAKDLHEHALVLSFVTMVLSGGWLLLALAALGAPVTMTYLDVHAGFMRFAVPALGLALGNRLVVAEMQGRTQRFLESLPMRPFEPLLAKWTLGLLVLALVSFGSLVFSLAIAAFREPIDVWFVVILATRTFVAIFVGWSFFFSMGLFGKLRVPLYLLFLLGLVIVANATSLELMRFGPFALLGMDFSLEREEMPWGAIGESFGVAAVFLVAGGIIPFLREGSVEERLSKPMSQRDLAMAGVALLSLLIALGELTPEPEPAPYRLPDDHVLRAAALPIAVVYLDDDAEADARALLSRLELDVGSFADTAGWTRLPQLRVVLRRSLDGSTFEPVTLAPHDGVLLRANFLADAEPDLDGLSAEVLGALLDARTALRARLEPRRWARDGLALHWAMRSPLHGDTSARAALALLATRSRGPDAPRMAAFEHLREEVGSRGAAALAATGFDAIAEVRGDGAIANVVRTAFPNGATDDFRVVVRDLLRPMPAVVSEATGLDAGALASVWSAHLDALRVRADVTTHVAMLGDPSATVTFETDADGVRTLVVRARTGAGPRSEGARTVTLHHFALGPFDRAVEDTEMVSTDVVERPDATAEIRVTGRYAAHDRVLVRVDLGGTSLDAPVRLIAARLEVP